MSCDTKNYHIYRIFKIDEECHTAKLRIVEDVSIFAKEVLKVFRNLELLKAEAYSISILPSNLSFQKTSKKLNYLMMK